MDFIEKDLEEIIWETQKTDEGRKLLAERGLDIRGKMFRQFNLGEYGTCDLLTIEFYDKYPHISVYELKRDLIDVNAVMQVCRYVTAIRRYIKYKYDSGCDVTSYLIGKTIQTNNDFVFLCNELNNIEILLYSIDINGLKFVPSVSGGWQMVGENELKGISIIIPFCDLRKICHWDNNPF